MSAYFSNMESKSMQAGEDPQIVAEKAMDRMALYLLFLRDNIEPDQLSKIDGFQSVLTAIHSQLYEYEVSPTDHIRALHTLAHDIGHGKVALRSGGFAGDNPYYRDRFTTED